MLTRKDMDELVEQIVAAGVPCGWALEVDKRVKVVNRYRDMVWAESDVSDRTSRKVRSFRLGRFVPLDADVQTFSGRGWDRRMAEAMIAACREVDALRP